RGLPGRFEGSGRGRRHRGWLCEACSGDNSRSREVSCQAPPALHTPSMIDVLHLFGNWKWTGPTELAVHLAEIQTKAGGRGRLAYGRQRGADDHFSVQVARRGIPKVEGFELAKHFEPTAIVRDSVRLARVLREEPPDVIHCHLGSDHLIAALG